MLFQFQILKLEIPALTQLVGVKPPTDASLSRLLL